MVRVVTLGEALLRLNSPGRERLFQSPALEATFCGGEVNVAVSLANYGMDVSFVTVLPDHDVGRACLRSVRAFGVDVSHVKFTEGRMGIYYLESGSNQRPSKVIYDREGSCMAKAAPDMFDWNTIFEGASWFHITGITPAISQNAADLSLAAVRTAKEMGLTVSCDLNYRKKLWKYGKDAREVMGGLMEYADVAIANEEDFQMSLGIAARSDVESGRLDREVYREIARTAMERYPKLQKVAITLRESVSADSNNWSACIFDGKEFAVSRKYAITDIVDRVGGGDSFSGGLIYGLNTYPTQTEALEFAVAASCLKHTIPGDFNRVSVKEAETLMRGSGSGRVER